jgi:putative PIN family toxin of toxin-antitoxin system
VSAAARDNKPPLVFLDSNVIFSGLYSPDGAPGRILELMLQGGIKVVVSRQTLEEVVRTFDRKLPQALPALSKFFLNSPISIVSDPNPGEYRRWTDTLNEGDACIFAAALAGGSDFFVTGDNHFLKNAALKKKSGMLVCSPSQLLQELGL